MAQTNGEAALAQVLHALPTDVLVEAGYPASAALLLLVSKTVRTALATRNSPLPVAFYPSALAELTRQYPRITSLTLSQETDTAAYAATMRNIAVALPFLGSLRRLDLSALRVEQAVERPTFDVAPFYASLEKHCPRLASVVFGQLAMDADGDCDDNFNHDTLYVACWIENAFETVNFADMDLHEEDANILLQACLSNPRLRSLSLANNAMYNLRLIAKHRNRVVLFRRPDTPALTTLDLSHNCLGSGHDDSEALTSAEDFADLVADFRSLRTLDLSHNRVNDAEAPPSRPPSPATATSPSSTSVTTACTPKRSTPSAPRGPGPRSTLFSSL